MNKYQPKIDVGKLLTTRSALEYYMQYLFQYMPNKDEERIKYKSLSKNQWNLYCYYLIEGQVTNGGFVQAFYNGYGKYLDGAIDALKSIEQHECAEIIRKAKSIGSIRILSFIWARAKSLFDSNLYDSNQDLDELDTLFYKFTTENDRRFRQFIWKERESFMADTSYTDNLVNNIHTSFHENGSVYQEYILTDMGIQGTYNEYNEKGTLVLRKKFDNSSDFDNYEMFYDSGEIKKSKKNDEGKFIITEWYENGNRKNLKTVDINDNADGLYIYWYENGKINNKGYSKGYLGYGKTEHYYEDGKIKMIGRKEGYNFFIDDFFLNDGTQTLKNGVGFTESHSIVDGKKQLRVDEYTDGVRNGKVIISIDGKVISTETYRDGSKI
ncbi:MAG: antitoxin component YwqK of YwqJK toxin-antitoxin module [Ulvibacter sp.]|jgi:antitoxin component YwqK of YwqJK toxin-antitoxin module